MAGGIIYKATNLVNGKVYIGQTTGTLTERRKQHLSAARSSTRRKYPFQRAIAKYGVAAFHWEVIDRCNSTEKLQELEVKWIAHYDSYQDAKKGYNRTPGGRLFPEDERYILQYDWQGNFIREYRGSYDAAEVLRIDPRGIRRCCQKACLSYAGYVFLFKNEFSEFASAEDEVTSRLHQLKGNPSLCFLCA